MSSASKFIRAKIENSYIDFVDGKYFVRFDIVVDSSKARAFNVYYTDEYNETIQFIVNVPISGRGTFCQKISRNPAGLAKLQIEFLPDRKVEVLDIALLNPHSDLKPVSAERDQTLPLDSNEGSAKIGIMNPVIPRPDLDCRNDKRLRVHYEGAGASVTGELELCIYSSPLCQAPPPTREVISSGPSGAGYVEFDMEPHHDNENVYYKYYLTDGTPTPWQHATLRDTKLSFYFDFIGPNAFYATLRVSH